MSCLVRWSLFGTELERLVASDSILSKKANKGIGYLTLGDRLGFLKRRERDVAHLFQDRGLSVKEIREAIEKVNKEKGQSTPTKKDFLRRPVFEIFFSVPGPCGERFSLILVGLNRLNFRGASTSQYCYSQGWS